MFGRPSGQDFSQNFWRKLQFLKVSRSFFEIFFSIFTKSIVMVHNLWFAGGIFVHLTLLPASFNHFGAKRRTKNRKNPAHFRLMPSALGSQYKTDFFKISRKIQKTANVWTANVSPTTVIKFCIPNLKSLRTIFIFQNDV